MRQCISIQYPASQSTTPFTISSSHMLNSHKLATRQVTYHYRHILLSAYFIFFLLGPTLELLGYTQYREYSLLMSKYNFTFPAGSSQFLQSYIFTILCLFALAIGLFIRKPRIATTLLASYIPFKNIFYASSAFSLFYSLFIFTASIQADNSLGLSSLVHSSGSTIIDILLESRLVFLVLISFFVEKILHKTQSGMQSLLSFLLYLSPLTTYIIAVFFSGTRSLLVEPLGILFICSLVQFAPFLHPHRLYLVLSLSFVVFNMISNYFLLQRLSDAVINLRSLLFTFEYGTYLFNMHIAYFDRFYSLFDFSYLNAITSLIPSAVRSSLEIQPPSSHSLIQEVGIYSSPFYFGGPSQIVELLLNFGPYLAVPALFLFGFALDSLGSSYYKLRLNKYSCLSTPLSVFPIVLIYSILLLRNPFENFFKSSVYTFIISVALLFALSRVTLLRTK